MRIAYLECTSGISGDMFLGALLDAGVPARVFEDTVAALNVGAQLEVSRVLRSGVGATKLDVIVDGEKDLPREVFQARQRAQRVQLQAAADDGHSHGDAHTHDHDHGHGHGHDHEHTHAPSTHFHHRAAHGRGLREIRELITRAPIAESARRRAIAIFENLGAAEAKVHNVSVEQVHLHEAGSVDAIVDIVCTAVGSEALGVEEWICSPLNVGGGTVECTHGTISIPSPAAVELLRSRNAPIYSSGIQKELVTPTGAAIVSVLAARFGAFPAMKIDNTGYGAGYRDLPGWPNVVRITVGEADDTRVSSPTETVTVLEANIDDLSPQVFGYVMERLLAEGALDVFTTPVQMKKSRPGLLLTVLCHPQQRDRLARLVFAETTTIGIRMREEQRYCLAREHVSVSTAWGDVRVKLARRDGEVTNFAPEYEDCRRIAAAHQVPLKTVIHEVIRLYLERKHEQ